jgi:hypothetical protein
MGPDTDPALFISDLQDTNKYYGIFLLNTFEGTFTSFFTDKKSQ